jgi:hypothetical protein
MHDAKFPSCLQVTMLQSCHRTWRFIHSCIIFNINAYLNIHEVYVPEMTKIHNEGPRL